MLSALAEDLGCGSGVPLVKLSFLKTFRFKNKNLPFLHLLAEDPGKQFRRLLVPMLPRRDARQLDHDELLAGFNFNFSTSYL